MGAFLDKPKMEKYNSHGEGNNLRYGLSSMQGWRVEMEDAHTAVIGLSHGLDLWSFFAVYDGHAGSQVAKYCCEHLLEHITSNSDFQSALQDDPCVDSVKNGIRTGFLQIDEHMRTISEKKHGVDRSGSTAVGVMISPSHIYFINCGDSRGLLSRGGTVHFFTQDHKPSNPLEKERIQNAGGSVMIQRVNGSLAVSRALGDFDYKCVHGKGPTEQLVSPEPEVYAIERSEGEDEFIILACDGIWDVMANEELCDFVRSRLEVTDDLEKVSNEIVDTCLYKGSRDNMSVVLVCFPGAPKVSSEAVKREAELDKYLEARVEEIIKKHGDEGVPDLVHVMRTLASESIPNLPPGGELASKRSVIEAVYNKLIPYRSDDTRVTTIPTNQRKEREDPWGPLSDNRSQGGGSSSRSCPAARFAPWRMRMAPWTAWGTPPVPRPVCPAKQPPRPSLSPPATVNVTSDGQIEGVNELKGDTSERQSNKQVIVPALR
uniref:protein phosphatase 1A isoform X1 n=1 Tax=Maylandia zebra TaxID=106582 RepID=UPI00064922F6|nr:protein phosphatase 1A isoform X1 [Maylandia zebra]